VPRSDRSKGGRPPSSSMSSPNRHVFAQQKGPMGLFIRTIGIARARTKIGLANLAYNMKRMLWLTAQAAPA
jgi:IS5 family transposase